jgi:hypothetical protein
LIGLTEEVRSAVERYGKLVSDCQSGLSALCAEVATLADLTRLNHERAMTAMRMVRDQDSASQRVLWTLRATREYEAAFEEDEPLVSVIIPTFSEWSLLRDRAIPSVLAQTYDHWEVIVVGDGAPDEAREVVESFHDERIRFVNLPYRGPYPEDTRSAWYVSGTIPWNTGIALARGQWIASSGDDDALKPTHLESLLECARRERAEVAYGLIHWRVPDSEGSLVGTFPPQLGQWQMQVSLLHNCLRFLPLEPSDWVFEIPNDWSLAERMLRIGVRFAMIQEPVADCYPHHLWVGREDRRRTEAAF